MSSITKVIVLGATGNTGVYIVDALLDAGCQVSALTRQTSVKSLPSKVNVITSDYTHDSLVKAFTGQDAIVSTIATFSTQDQIKMIDAAIAAGVKRFVPSEYGIDTSDTALQEHLPPVKGKQDTVEYLQSKESAGLSWTALIVGCYFDWALKTLPGMFGYNVGKRKVTLYDGGTAKYEATNLPQIGRAVAAILKSEETKNRYVYVNSFTISQKEVLAALEKVTGSKFEVSDGTREGLKKSGLERMEAGDMSGVVEAISAQIFNLNGVNNYSSTKDLWNDKLGLPMESLEDTLREVVKSVG